MMLGLKIQFGFCFVQHTIYNIHNCVSWLLQNIWKHLVEHLVSPRIYNSTIALQCFGINACHVSTELMCKTNGEPPYNYWTTFHITKTAVASYVRLTPSHNFVLRWLNKGNLTNDTGNACCKWARRDGYHCLTTDWYYPLSIMDIIYNMNWPRRGDDETQITHAESLLRKKKNLEKKKEVELWVNFIFFIFIFVSRLSGVARTEGLIIRWIWVHR